MHASYSKYGMKPHFLDIFQQQFIGLLFRLKEHESYDRETMLQGYTLLLTYMIERMNVTYAEAIQQMRTKEEKEPKEEQEQY
uniref:TetR_C_8 domain-containing protein n=2 Tax=Bursaphelenchus xylophilus TaxID=6326 RepID=A0A1I7SNN4_BURXY